MGPKADIPWDKIKAVTPGPALDHLGRPASDDHIPPKYYDSEPSSQPPKYPNTQAAQSSDSPSDTLSISKPAVPHRGHSAPGNMVAAILASPDVDIDAQRRAERKSRTLGQRMKGFWERNVGEAYRAAKTADGSGNTSSSAEVNVFGARILEPSSNRRKSKK